MSAVTAKHASVLPFALPQQEESVCLAAGIVPVPAIGRAGAMATDYTLLEIDRELDLLFDQMQDEIEETGTAQQESIEQFHALCAAFGGKVDRIGGFIRVMEARSTYCRNEASRLAARAKTAENKVDQAKSLVLYFLQSRGITKMEGKQFTLRRQKNSQDSVHISDASLVPFSLKRVEARFPGATWELLREALPETMCALLEAGVHEITPINDAIKQTIAAGKNVEGAIVSRGHHVRVA